MCSGLAGEGEASCSVPRPPLLPGAYCKCVQDETPTIKHFLPVPVSRSASCKCHGGCGEFERAAFARVWSAGDWGGGGRQEGCSRGFGLRGLVPWGCVSVGSHGLRFCFFLGGHWGAMPQSCVVSRCRCVGRWGDTFRRDENSWLHGFFSENWPADGGAGLGSRKPVSGRCGEAKGCARLLGPGLLVH